MPTLYVYVPGLMGGVEGFQPVVDRLEEDESWDGRYLPFDSRIRLWTRRRFADAATELARYVETQWSGEDVVLMGHSLGGLVVRHAYLQGLGEYGPEVRHEWAGCVRRLVLFAAPNRGISRERLKRRHHAAVRAVGTFWPLSLLDIRAGAPFVTDLRIRWMRTFARLEDEGRDPYVVQLLGQQDSLVVQKDSLDVEQMRKAAHVTVPSATHGSVVRAEGPDSELRYAKIREAVLGEPRPTEPPDRLPADEAARPVVFLLHGIRAGTDDWVSRAKDKLARREERPVVRTPSYGYFSALSFALPFARAGNVRVLLDAYGEERAQRPRAPFHFVGHSNGTYVLGKALRTVGAVSFENVYLAGSVLPPRYPWRERFESGQVTRLRNDRAAKDVPVGIICPAICGRGNDIGPGGVTGFLDDHERKREVRYFAGGHGAALADDQNLDGVVEYALTGAATEPDVLVPGSKGFAFAGRLARLAVPVAALVGLFFLGKWLTHPFSVRRLIAVVVAAIVAYVVGKTV